MSSSTYSYSFCSNYKWLTQIFVDCNRFNKGEINEVLIECDQLNPILPGLLKTRWTWGGEADFAPLLIRLFLIVEA